MVQGRNQEKTVVKSVIEMQNISKVPSVYAPQAECCACGFAAPGKGKTTYAERKRPDEEWYDYLCSTCLVIFSKLDMNYRYGDHRPIPRDGWKVKTFK
jgi:hypothetical protein